MIELTEENKIPVRLLRNDYLVEDRRIYPEPIILFTYPKGRLLSQKPVDLVAVGAFPDYSAEMADTLTYIEREIDGKLSFYTSFPELPKRENYLPSSDRNRSIENLKNNIRASRLDKPVFQSMRENFASLCKFNNEFDFYFTEDKIYSVKPEERAEFEARIQTPGVWHSRGTVRDFAKYISYMTFPWDDAETAPMKFLSDIDLTAETERFFAPQTWDMVKVMMDLARKGISLQVHPSQTSIWDMPYMAPRGVRAKTNGSSDLYPMPTIEGIVANAGCVFTEVASQILPAIDPIYNNFLKSNDELLLPSPIYRTVLPTSRLELWSNFSHMRAQPECFLPSRLTMMSQIVSNHAIVSVAQDPTLVKLMINEDTMEEFDQRVFTFGFDCTRLDLNNVINLSWLVNFYFANHAEMTLAAKNVASSLGEPVFTPGPLETHWAPRVREILVRSAENGFKPNAIKGGEEKGQTPNEHLP